MSQLSIDKMEEIVIEMDGENYSLADIANIDMDGVSDNFGFEPTPSGVYDFEVKSAILDSFDYEDESGEEVTVPSIKFEFDIIGVHSCADPEQNPSDLIGMQHNENYSLFAPIKKSAGKAKVLMREAAGITSGSMIDRLAEFNGKRFTAAVKKARSSRDKEKFFSNIELRKVRPYEPSV